MLLRHQGLKACRNLLINAPAVVKVLTPDFDKSRMWRDHRAPTLNEGDWQIGAGRRLQGHSRVFLCRRFVGMMHAHFAACINLRASHA